MRIESRAVEGPQLPDAVEPETEVIGIDEGQFLTRIARRVQRLGRSRHARDRGRARPGLPRQAVRADAAAPGDRRVHHEDARHLHGVRNPANHTQRTSPARTVCCWRHGCTRRAAAAASIRSWPASAEADRRSAHIDDSGLEYEQHPDPTPARRPGGPDPRLRRPAHARPGRFGLASSWPPPGRAANWARSPAQVPGVAGPGRPPEPRSTASTRARRRPGPPRPLEAVPQHHLLGLAVRRGDDVADHGHPAPAAHAPRGAPSGWFWPQRLHAAAATPRHPRRRGQRTLTPTSYGQPGRAADIALYGEAWRAPLDRIKADEIHIGRCWVEPGHPGRKRLHLSHGRGPRTSCTDESIAPIMF